MISLIVFVIICTYVCIYTALHWYTLTPEPEPGAGRGHSLLGL